MHKIKYEYNYCDNIKQLNLYIYFHWNNNIYYFNLKSEIVMIILIKLKNIAHEKSDSISNLPSEFTA